MPERETVSVRKLYLYRVEIDGCVTYHVCAHGPLDAVKAMLENHGADEDWDDSAEVVVTLYEKETMTVGGDIDWQGAEGDPDVVEILGGPVTETIGGYCQHCVAQREAGRCVCTHCRHAPCEAPREITRNTERKVKATIDYWTRERGVVASSEY